MEFRNIEVEGDRETVVSFHLSLIRDATGKQIVDFDEDEYIDRLRNKVERFPDGYVMVLKEEQSIGYMELQVKSYEGRSVGYISAIYVQPNFRGQGISREMLNYAECFFRGQSVGEYHLRVDVGNVRAQRFYEKAGLSQLGSELNSLGNLCYRLVRQL